MRREVLVHHQRERILNAAIELVAESGYRPVRVIDIHKRAVISRSRFYQNFGSKEDCFLAAYERAADLALERVKGACGGSGGGFPERVGAGLDALLDYLDAEPAVARACIIEAPAVGAPIEPHREAALEHFAELLAGAREDGGQELGPSVEETTIGGLHWLLYQALLEGKPKRLATLAPTLTEYALTPFLGATEARRATAAQGAAV